MTKTEGNLNKKIPILIEMIGCLALSIGCTNSPSPLFPISLASSTPAPASTAAIDNYQVSTVSITGVASTTASPTPSPSATGTSTSSATSSGTAVPTATLFLSTATVTSLNITNHCNVSVSGTQTQKLCDCNFVWNEINPSDSTSTNTRSVTTSVTVVQPALVSCALPNVYSSEIPDGTQIRITVVADPTNPDNGAFSVAPYIYTKTASVTGSFQTAQGQYIDNILHYACYETFTPSSGLKVFNSIDPNSNVVWGTKFCTYGDSGCNSASSPGYSANAYYYNLYVRSSESGDINLFNNSYVCPTVVESLNSNGTLGTQNQPWPLDSNFALALSSSNTFTVGVVANTQLDIGSSTSASQTCFPSASSSSTPTTTTTTGGSNSIDSSCLGFAALPNADGTCPSIADSSGLLRPTFRLRRYIAIYPRYFNSTGLPDTTRPQSSDTIYVLDRPVKGPTGSDPLKPYTMLGPKPCPFAFFDANDVAYQTVYKSPRYVSTGDTHVNGKNIDGVEFPNQDSSNSCSASLPVLSADKTFFSFITINKNHPNSEYQHRYVRPMQNFTPHYEEDTSFQACAPQASPFQDPPLHFSREPTTGNVAWCAESYPTQNSNIMSLDPPQDSLGTAYVHLPSGNVAPYTSHVSKNTTSAACTYTAITIPTTNYNYPGAILLNQSGSTPAPSGVTPPLYAQHPSTVSWDTATANKTCDRTVATTGLAWTKFPLLSQPDQIEANISLDKSYMCLMTYDSGGGKTGNNTPTDGCCSKSIVRVVSGFAAGATAAHLEPDFACGTPNY